MAGNFPLVDVDAIAPLLLTPAMAIAVYWLWIYPIRNGIQAAKKTGRTVHWMWLAAHPMFGWPVYLWIRRGTWHNSLTLDSFSTKGRWLAGLGLTLWVLPGLVLLVTSRLAALQYAVLFPMLAATASIPLWLLLPKGRARKTLGWTTAAAWLVSPVTLSAAAIQQSPVDAVNAAKLGALGGFALLVLLIVSGNREIRTVWYDRSGRVVASTPWRSDGSFVRFAGGLLTLAVAPLIGAMIGLSIQGAKTLGFWR